MKYRQCSVLMGFSNKMKIDIACQIIRKDQIEIATTYHCQYKKGFLFHHGDG